MELIRPLYRVHEEDIIAWKNAHELSFIQCACRFTENCTLCDNGGGGSKRQEVKQLLKYMNRDGGKVEKNVFNAIHMLQFDTFPGWKSNGVEHSFLETYDDVQTTVTGVEEE
jgi:tRNA(Ile)-lysidine synthase TilS/MesJ